MCLAPVWHSRKNNKFLGAHPPADPFAPFDPADPFRDYRAGVDAARVRIFPSAFSEIDGAVRIAEYGGSRTTTALLPREGRRGGGGGRPPP